MSSLYMMRFPRCCLSRTKAQYAIFPWLNIEADGIFSIWPMVCICCWGRKVNSYLVHVSWSPVALSMKQMRDVFSVKPLQIRMRNMSIQREYALDDRKVFFADGQIYVVLNSKPWKPESFYTHIQVPTPDSTLLVMHKNPSEEEFMLVETKTSLRSNDMTACITTMTRHWW